MDNKLHTGVTGKVKIFCAGGAGTNIGYHYNDVAPTPGFAECEVVYIDTSTANLKDGIAEDQFYHIGTPEGAKLDGSGGVRRDNAAHIAANIKPMLKTHVPEQFNIVVFSATGGYLNSPLH